MRSSTLTRASRSRSMRYQSPTTSSGVEGLPAVMYSSTAASSCATQERMGEGKE